MLAVAAALSALVLAACSGTGDERAQESSPFAACPPAAPTSTAPAGGTPVPDIALDCFAGGPRVSLRTLGRPAVVNFFASWCAPCRAELPAVQRLADTGQVLVLGVVTRDTRSAAADLATETGVRFPAVFDPDQALLARLGRTALPVTLFVDATGRIAHVHTDAALSDATLTQLVRDKLHVDLP
ncbi:TlpA disulfide reductase family protein [Luedemannella helvata]|uniref:TlpA disulfide reductase family protein n=1 Tax=Luedemannella helvata TaxID=349315 RepID=A0ABP4WJG7_9ACTN